MNARGSKRQVSVIGNGSCAEDSEPWRLAEEVGRRLAEAAATVVCGGMSGVMEAVAKGAAEGGGEAIGIVPTESVDDANPHCTHVVATGIGHARNLAVVASGEVVIAVGGEWGTLAEIAFARRLGRTVVALSSWNVSGEGEMEAAPGIVAAATPEEAVHAALEALRSARMGGP